MSALLKRKFEKVYSSGGSTEVEEELLSFLVNVSIEEILEMLFVFKEGWGSSFSDYFMEDFLKNVLCRNDMTVDMIARFINAFDSIEYLKQNVEWFSQELLDKMKSMSDSLQLEAMEKQAKIVKNGGGSSALSSMVSSFRPDTEKWKKLQRWFLEGGDSDDFKEVSIFLNFLRLDL